MATTEESTAAKLNVQPTDNSFQDFVIDYNGDTKVMTVTYAGQTFTRNLTDWIKNSGGTTFSLSMTASTGGAKIYNKFNLEHSSIQNQLLLKYAM